jgi:hypothetical protein
MATWSRAGVIDPTKVVRSALQHAASVAGLLVTVAERPENKAAAGGLPVVWAAWAAAWVIWTSNWALCQREGATAAPWPLLLFRRMIVMEIYWGSGSPFAWQVLLALEVKKIPYASRLLEFSKGQHKSPEYLALNQLFGF